MVLNKDTDDSTGGYQGQPGARHIGSHMLVSHQWSTAETSPLLSTALNHKYEFIEIFEVVDLYQEF